MGRGAVNAGWNRLAGTLAGWAVFAAVVGPDPSVAAESGRVSGTMPEIKIDATEIDRTRHAPVTSYAGALEEIQGAVVSVHSSKIVRPRGLWFDDPLLRWFYGRPARPEARRQEGLGSGVIISPDGFILTNNHVIAGFDDIRVSLSDGQELKAEVVGGDPRTDVAVLKIDREGLPAATLANSDQLRIGDIVFAVGNPLGVGQTTTMGIVSATGRSNLPLIEQGYQDFIQTDAPINFGNSGGALVDADGRLVGINTAIISNSQGNIGIGLAIPVNLAAKIMRDLIEVGKVTRGFLGVETQEIDDLALAEEFGLSRIEGVVVTGVVEGSPAEQAGLRYGDVLLEMNGRRVENRESLRVWISMTPPSSEVVFTVMRDGRRVSVPVVLSRVEDEAGLGDRVGDELLDGISVAELNSAHRNHYGIPPEIEGLVVVETEPHSRYVDVLPEGTVISQINRRSISDLRSGRTALVRGRNLFFVYYQGAYRYVLIGIN